MTPDFEPEFFLFLYFGIYGCFALERKEEFFKNQN